MPSAENFEWPQGNPLFEVQWRTVTESLAGNGIVNNGDFEVTATATDMEISVAAGTAFYIGSNYNLGAAETHVLSDGDANDDRWDTVYFDTGTSSSGVREGTPAANPEPPDISGGELLLAIVYVPAGATNISNTEILNWRAKFSNEAEEVQYDDTTGTYGVNNVDAALDELQEAAQITAYPFALGTDTDMDAAGTDLVDGATTIWDTSATEVPQAQLGGPASSLSTYPLAPATDLNINAYPFALADLASPFSLPSITDMDAAGNDLTDSTASKTIWDTSEGYVPRPSVDDKREVRTETSGTSNTTITTADEEIILVDTETNAIDFDVTLASADAVSGNTIRVVDVGGGAQDNPITISTEGSETINGASTDLISENYGALTLTWGGGEWSVTGSVTSGAGVASEEDFSGAETGQVAASSQGVLIVSSLEPDETVEVYRAVLTTDTVEAVATGVDLKLVTFDNAGGYTTQSTLITGDGATVFDDETGAPLASYTNAGTAAESIGVIVDNTLTSAVDIVSDVEGATGR
ncbi:T4 gp9/gp10-like baseplate protein [Haloarcula virus HVTV-2]|uniref:Tail baseplate n=1 Tax=Haloarcula vallismortis tailed virus 1 TaxID=1262528 RepID=L7TKJ5_9CAUD|nr:baseplate protein [Haloarcula vallismortis tailed virus 1]AGC34505.1 tail baseplate [Haloarcula vallismortis tailed virus 1]UBF22944.1 T4 gp9/gp10-like baseplate protein [Haloarcula virus HVTV-2]